MIATAYGSEPRSVVRALMPALLRSRAANAPSVPCRCGSTRSTPAIEHRGRHDALGRRIEPPVGMLGEKTLDLLVVLLGLERAGAVDEQSARLARRSRPTRRIARCSDAITARSEILSRQRASGCRRNVPVPVHGASTSTRSTGLIAGMRASATYACSVSISRRCAFSTHALQPRERQVAREDLPTRCATARRLSARGRAEVGDDRARRHARVLRDERRRRILHVKQSLAERSELGERRHRARQARCCRARAARRRRGCRPTSSIASSCSRTT